MRWFVVALLFVVAIACEDGTRKIVPLDKETVDTDTGLAGDEDTLFSDELGDGIIDTDDDTATTDTAKPDAKKDGDNAVTDDTVTDDNDGNMPGDGDEMDDMDGGMDDTTNESDLFDDTVTDDTVDDDTVTDDAEMPDVDTCVCTAGACCDGCHYRASDYVCRVAADAECDVAETCTGGSADCPIDGFTAINTPCGDQTGGECDEADSCDGNGACLDNHWTENDPCNDGAFCNGNDTCNADGECINHAGDPCAAGDACNDTCNETDDTCFSPDTTPCDDTVFCNGADTCNGSGVCGTHEGDPCNGTICSEDQGKCCDGGWAGADCEICVRFVQPASILPVTGDGLTWDSAFNEIQDAIDGASDSVQAGDAATCEVWVAQGSYYIYKTATGDHIQLADSVHLYGGFAGGESLRYERDFVNNVTIIDGRQSAAGVNRVSHIVYGIDNALLDGFTLTEGQAISGRAAGYAEGGALYLDNASMTIRNDIFTNNSAVSSTYALGGAISLFGGSTVSIDHCIFSDNSASISTGDSGYGGAIYASDTGTLTITDSIFSANTVAQSTATSGSAYGGALSANNGLTLTVTDSLFYDNALTSSGTARGGAIRVNNATLTATNCTFSQNTAKDGAAIANLGSSNTTLVNSILYANTGTNTWSNTRQLYDEIGGGAITATYSDIEMTTDSNFAGTGNIHGDPLFIDAANNDFHLLIDTGAGTYSPCIDTADDAVAPATDLDGNARVDVPLIGTATADMGCYEFVY